MRWDTEEKLLQYMTEGELLDSLVLAMSEEEAAENFEYIARCHEIDLTEDEEQTEEQEEEQEEEDA